MSDTIEVVVIPRDKTTDLKNGIYTDCSNCPCLNNDYEYGSSCNLGYNTDSLWLKEDDLRDVSSNCFLDSIIYYAEEKLGDITQKTKKIFTQQKFKIIDV